MNDAIDSGLHPIRSLFGHTVSGIVQESQQIKEQLRGFEQLHKTAQSDEHPGNVLIAVEVIVAIVILVAIAIYNADAYESRIDLGLATVVVTGVLIATVTVTYRALNSSPSRAREEFRKQCRELRSRLLQKEKEYERSVVETMTASAEKRAEVARVSNLGNSKVLFYCPSCTAMIDFGGDQAFVINTIHCREVQLSYRETERQSQSVNTISSRTTQSLAGAVVGGLVFGGSGMIAGSVIGSAGERKGSTHTIEKITGKYVVDVYTRLHKFPVITIDFDSNEAMAKEYYAVVSAALPNATK
jgi:hypothetical protein